MAKRKTVKKVSTDELQGENSYVIVTAVKTKEIKQTRRESQAVSDAQKEVEKRRKVGDEDIEDVEPYDAFGSGLDMIRRHLKEWDWVDDDGVPLPQPKEDPNVLDELTIEEVTFLANLLTGEEDSKN